MRNPVACVGCRTAKRQCINNDRPPCKRCKHRGEFCLFPPRGTSFIHRQPKPRTAVLRASSPSDDGEANSRPPQGADHRSHQDLSSTNPFKLFTDDVKNSYLRCSYKWSFHHVPSLIDGVQKETLDRGMMWAILALAIRFTDTATAPFQTPIEASNAFAAYAKSIILPSIEEPTISRIQGLLLIAGHSWGSGGARQAWIYLGMAVRMAQVIGLFSEDQTYQSREDFIIAEERRRTAWTCFLMDSLLSGGKDRRRALAAKDVRLQLPCETDNFYFGEPVQVEMFDGSLSPLQPIEQAGKIGIIAYTIRVADIWGAVARWACSSAVKGELPWESNSEFQHQLADLHCWRHSLPDRLKFNISNLHTHTTINQGQAFCYMHCIYFMSVMFLYRPYVSQAEEEIQHSSDSDFNLLWHQWRSYSRQELFQVADKVCEALQEMQAFGFNYLRGLVPWIGFTIYTTVGIMLYYHHFPGSDVDDQSMKKCRDHIRNGCALLKEMRGSWPMADRWRESIRGMQVFYTHIATKGDVHVSLAERRAMQDAMVDYGALQSRHEEEPVQPYTGHSSTNPTTSNTSPLTSSPGPSVTTVSSTDNTTIPSSQVYANLNPLDCDMFDTDFNFEADNDETVLSTVNEEFWANFPGEFGS